MSESSPGLIHNIVPTQTKVNNFLYCLSNGFIIVTSLAVPTLLEFFLKASTNWKKLKYQQLPSYLKVRFGKPETKEQTHIFLENSVIAQVMSLDNSWEIVSFNTYILEPYYLSRIHEKYFFREFLSKIFFREFLIKIFFR